MDAISYSYADKQAKRIKKFIENPDSNSGIVTFPKVIEAGETVTIKSGRQAILADTTIERELVVEAGADVFVPSGAGFNDLDQRIDGKVSKTGNETVAGVKTFSSFPVTPSSAPTTNYQTANKEYVDDRDALKVNKNEISYNVNTSSFIPNTLTSGAIIERGSNANGDYIKYADGTLIC